MNKLIYIIPIIIVIFLALYISPKQEEGMSILLFDKNGKPMDKSFAIVGDTPEVGFIKLKISVKNDDVEPLTCSIQELITGGGNGDETILNDSMSDNTERSLSSKNQVGSWVTDLINVEEIISENPYTFEAKVNCLSNIGLGPQSIGLISKSVSISINEDPDCGNDIKELGELCDGTDHGELMCYNIGLEFFGGTLGCESNCQSWNTNLCSDLDICSGLGGIGCGSGQYCSEGTMVDSNDYPDLCCMDGTCNTQICTNGIIEGTEICDVDDFGGLTCDDYTGVGSTGQLTCIDCMEIHSTHCSPPLPTCSSLGGEGCSLGEDCVWGYMVDSSDYSNLCCIDGTCMETVCGNEVIEGEEVCDMFNFGGLTCDDFIPGTIGTLYCLEDCTIIDDYYCELPPESHLYESHYLGSDPSSYKNIYTNTWASQRFSAIQNFQLHYINAQITKNLAPSSQVGSPLIMEIRNYDLSTQKPGSSVLATATVPESSITQDVYNWIEFNLDTPITLNHNQQYIILFRTLSGDSSNKYAVKFNDAGNYFKGNLYTSFNSGGSWSLSYDDMLFEAYGTSVGVEHVLKDNHMQSTTSGNLLGGNYFAQSFIPQSSFSLKRVTLELDAPSSAQEGTLEVSIRDSLEGGDIYFTTTSTRNIWVQDELVSVDFGGVSLSGGQEYFLVVKITGSSSLFTYEYSSGGGTYSGGRRINHDPFGWNDNYPNDDVYFELWGI